MSPAARRVAPFVRSLPDHDLNDLLVELLPARFAGLLEAAFAAPQVGVPVRYHPARPRAGEATRWTVEAHRLEHWPGMRAPVPAWTVLGAVIQQQVAGPRGGTPVAWHAATYQGQRVGDPRGHGWPTRRRATAALLWHCPAMCAHSATTPSTTCWWSCRHGASPRCCWPPSTWWGRGVWPHEHSSPVDRAGRRRRDVRAAVARLARPVRRPPHHPPPPAPARLRRLRRALAARPPVRRLAGRGRARAGRAPAPGRPARAAGARPAHPQRPAPSAGP